MSDDQALRVLLVDDELRLLDGLRRAMRACRVRWNMAFALGGGEALSHLSTEAVDIVISDMRMPGVDGPLLLGEIARLYPDTIRIVLSGQTDAASTRHAMRVAHQFLAKPIAAPALVETIIRLRNARRRLADDVLRGRASAVSVLPASPALYDDLMRLCDQADASAAQFAEVIERDPAMTAKLLQLAGSAFFGRPLRATGMVQLVGSVGLDALRGVVRDGGLATAGAVTPDLTAEVAMHQCHALRVARIARQIAPEDRLRDDAYTAGLLHDVGKLLMLGQSGDAGIHAAVGGYLLGIWGLPEDIVAAVADHHEQHYIAGANPLADVIRAANTMAHDTTDDELAALESKS
jgi:HD-like signal output (HDOD) protein